MSPTEAHEAAKRLARAKVAEAEHVIAVRAGDRTLTSEAHYALRLETLDASAALLRAKITR